MRTTYHVVVSADGTVMRVFDSRNLVAAQQLARQMSRPGASFFVETVVRRAKPLTGCKLYGS